MTSATADLPARDRLIETILARTMPLTPRSSAFQCKAIKQLGAELGWPVDWLVETEHDHIDDSANRFRGKQIAIYSLAENASRMASVIIEGITNVEVLVNAEHVDSQSLRVLAAKCDLFIIVWSAASHTPTNLSCWYRGSLRIVYEEGKGLISIVWAGEEFAARVS